MCVFVLARKSMPEVLKKTQSTNQCETRLNNLPKLILKRPQKAFKLLPEASKISSECPIPIGRNRFGDPPGLKTIPRLPKVTPGVLKVTPRLSKVIPWLPKVTPGKPKVTTQDPQSLKKETFEMPKTIARPLPHLLPAFARHLRICFLLLPGSTDPPTHRHFSPTTHRHHFPRTPGRRNARSDRMMTTVATRTSRTTTTTTITASATRQLSRSSLTAKTPTMGGLGRSPLSTAITKK